ncbi:MAG: carbamoyl-phosphate synthase large subunit [Chloroflexota bacterium]|nr:carbamoyl-phosphate synthase large subunit [Chloroflexota bacterium]
MAERRPGALALEDGRVYPGWLFGAPPPTGGEAGTRPGEGEVVFNTCMTGYQEILTDPSYAGQLIVMTYPLIGNYGVNDADPESGRIWARALVTREVAGDPSNWRAAGALEDELAAAGVPGLTGVDTRSLTRHLRSAGARRAVVVELERPYDPRDAASRELAAELARRAESVTPIEDQDLVAETACTAPYEWDEELAPVYVRPFHRGEPRTVVVVDYGLKRNILRSLASRGWRVVVVPPGSSAADVMAHRPDGVLLSNGPGDPARLDLQVKTATALIGQVPILGICLGHQIIGRAAGATTAKMPFGHHGGNHPVRDDVTGEVHITSQNHEFQVLAESLPADSGFTVRQRNLNDDSVESLAHRDLPVFSVQYHPEGAPGPHDNQYVFDVFADMMAGGRPPAAAATVIEPPPRPRKVLVIGSGPIIIGQAAEFDYAGTQACKALREEGVETVLVNSNPATIMTEPGVADHTYIEPLTVEVIERIIAREQPDGLLPTLGGQTGLNMAVALDEAGVLARYNVRLLGTPLETIRKAEDREAFKQFLQSIDEPVVESRTVETVAQAREFLAEVGLPLVVRPAFTLGGTGGGFIHAESEFDAAVQFGLDASPITQVLLERSLQGWKEVEYEVMRDANDTCITVCNMENLDPMGVHTGDSIVVAPSQTLSDKEYQMLRSSALKIIRGLGIEGGCNVQYALDPHSFRYNVIEVNPRVSRSSALASKATGYPIARVAAKVAIGKRLDEIPNAVTGRTLAAFEPALDYCVVKIPRWPFDKFPTADRSIGTQMKATGEVMAVERTFEAALVKALRSMEQKPPALDGAPIDETLLSQPNDRRLYALLAALRQWLPEGAAADAGGEAEVIERLHGLTSIDRWFLRRLAHIVAIERRLAAGLEPGLHREAKTSGFTDARIAALSGEPLEDVRAAAFEAGIHVAYKLVDTCAAEFAAATPYYYSTYEAEDESPRGQRQDTGRSVLVLGSGPIRIGQGIEFDYCSVQAALTLRESGWSSAMLNSNPETVSTDFDTSDRLYFDPLDEESAENVINAESAVGVMVQFGGQTAINLAEPLERRGAKILGSQVDAIDLAEDRRRFEATLREIGIPQPPGATATTVEEAHAIADRVGYPVLVRPSYVLGGRAMEIVHAPEDLERYLEGARDALARGTILVDKYLVGGEFEVDAICDGERVLIPGIMEHVERAGVHSGDSFAVYPAQHLAPDDVDLLVDYTRRIALRLSIRGLLNIQYVLHRNRLYVIEVNPRASRTVPFLSKVTGVPMVPVATRVATGETLEAQGYEDGLWPESDLVAVKAPVFSMSKLLEVDSHLGPEMKSTGEVMGIDHELAPAMFKAFLASLDRLPRSGGALCTIADGDKAEALPIIARLAEMGFTVHATSGTARALREAGISVNEVGKIADGSPHVVDLIKSGTVDLVVNTISNDAAGTRATDGAPLALRDGFEIRRAAVERRIPCLTSLDTAAALVESLNLLALDGAFEVKTVDEYTRAGTPPDEPLGSENEAWHDHSEIPLDVPEDREEAML